ncbi:uncharacterized protein [Bos indicus]|uniref:Uncharacterized protein n=1 Tax=Bos indicus TaxID=9915 RepID=A0ABM4QKF1_BOSIN
MDWQVEQDCPGQSSRTPSHFLLQETSEGVWGPGGANALGLSAQHAVPLLPVPQQHRNREALAGAGGGGASPQGTGRERGNHPSHVGVGCALGQKTGVPRRGALPGHRARSAVEPVAHRHRVPAPPPLPPAGTGASSATARTARRPSSPPGARSRSRRPDSTAIATLPGASRRSAAGPKPRRAEGGLSPEAQMRTRRGAGQPVRW